jgi:diguanylate cyclase (GGDEF)-like protein
MPRDNSAFDERIEQLLADPSHRGHPLHGALDELWQLHLEDRYRLERVTHLSDAYQQLARQRETHLGERFNKQLRQLEKLARISDRYQQMMRDLNLALNEASNRDVLTGLGNRRLLMDRLKEESERATRRGQGYTLAMLDVDQFKQVNDTHGHETGDRVLVAIANTLQAGLREYDLGGRWGGEEFLVLLPETSAADAMVVLERVRQNIADLAVRTDSDAIQVTASIGLSQHIPGETFSLTINRADAALMEAKREGRNRAVMARMTD